MHRGFTCAAAGRGVCFTVFLAFLCAGLLAACGPRHAVQVVPAAPSPEQRFTTLERRYVIFMLGRFPVVSTYLGGSEFDAALADNDGKLRDYSAEALKDEDAR